MSLAERFHELDKSIARNIEDHGLSLIGVIPYPGEAPFTYSVGFTDLDSPEVIVAGLPPRVAQNLINDVYAAVKAGDITLVPGAVLEGYLADDYKMTVCAVTDEHEANVTRTFYVEPTFVQLVFPDMQHRFPWDEGYDQSDALQRDWFVAP